jgi:hypothetical protein
MAEPIRVLLDESVSERLRRAFSADVIVETVGDREWKGNLKSSGAIPSRAHRPPCPPDATDGDGELQRP